MTSTEPPLPSTRALGLLLGLVAIAGCGGPSDGFERFPVEGRITVDVTDGAFHLRKSDGLSPGPYKVEIFSIQPTGKKVPSAEDPQTLIDEMTNLVPKQYNVQSQLKADIPPGGPKEPLTFPLSSVRPKRAR